MAGLARTRRPALNVDYSIVIPAYNEEALLPRTLRCVEAAMARLAGREGEVIVVDNASSDRTPEIAAARGARLVREPHRQIARARNAGARAARGRHLVFLDADTLIPPLLLRRSLEALETGRFVGGGTTIDADRPLALPDRLFFSGVVLLMKLARLAAGSYLFCLGGAFEGTGGFDERYYASEEIHFSQALKRWGRRRGLRFVVLREKALTSARKLDWLGFRGIIGGFLRVARDPKALESREGCPMWYERPDVP